MDKKALQQRVDWLFVPPAPPLRAGVEAAGELPTPAESEQHISAWVETPSAGIRLELQNGGLLRVLAYDPVSGREVVVCERSIEAFVRETLHQQ